MTGKQWVQRRGCTIWVLITNAGACPAYYPRRMWSLYAYSASMMGY